MTRTLTTVLLLGAAQISFAQECGNYTVEQLRPGGRVDWSRAHGDIAFDDDQDRDGYFDVRVMSLRNPAADHCVTCTDVARRTPGLQLNKGQPAWHPSGEYIVFQAEIAGSQAGPKASNPGRGVNNVLWLADRYGNWFVQLTQADAGARATGVLHPHFSDDGAMLSWTEMYEPWNPLVPGKGAGYWRLKKARLDWTSNPPRLVEVETYLPMQEGFYENHGFSPDGSLIIFSSNAMRSGLLDRINNDIFTLDWRTGAVKRLTETRYNEHASFFPDGRHVLWMTNRNNPDRGTDLWVMSAPRPRAEEQRLTYFNRAGCPGADGGRMIAADSSLNATGDALVVYVQREVLADDGVILLVRFPPF